MHKTLLRIDVEWNGSLLHLCTTHLQAGYPDEFEECRLREIEDILRQIQALQSKPLLLVGDLNAFAPGDPVDALPIGSAAYANRRFIEQGKRLAIARLQEAGLVDCYRALRAHSRLSWAERLARNTRSLTTGQVTIQLFGVPEAFAAFLGLALI